MTFVFNGGQDKIGDWDVWEGERENLKNMLVVDRKGIRESWVWKIGCCVVGPWLSGIVSVSTAYKRVQSPTQLIAFFFFFFFLLTYVLMENIFLRKTFFSGNYLLKKVIILLGLVIA